MTITYKIASTEVEFEQIHCLNYKTFVEEIPQHHSTSNQRLVDRFHDQNTYLIACDGADVIGMLALRDQRPFSLDQKLEGLDEYLPSHQSVCELRLLSVEKKYRRSRVFFGLAQLLAAYCLQKKYDLAIMSGTVRQLKLYSQMGFVPFGQLVGADEALYQPMYLTKDTFESSLIGRLQPRATPFLPGPVPIHSEVAAALNTTAISHRSEEFKQTMKRVQTILCEMTHSNYVEIMVGTGTLANDAIAAQIRRLEQKGLILTNGEFGERLVDHADRAGLNFAIHKKNWGEPYEKPEVISRVRAEEAKWVWAVHGETSTGMLNDLEGLKDVCRETNALLCLDTISSLGSVPINLDNVYFASGVSGKAIGGYTGLAFVFHQENLLPTKDIPRFLDLGLYQAAESIPYSHSSNLLRALQTALELNSAEDCSISSKMPFIRQEITEMGLSIVTPESVSLPFIITIQIPSPLSSRQLGDIMATYRYKLHYESSYLIKRNWIQISVLGQKDQDIEDMITAFKLHWRLANHDPEEKRESCG